MRSLKYCQWGGKERRASKRSLAILNTFLTYHLLLPREEVMWQPVFVRLSTKYLEKLSMEFHEFLRRLIIGQGTTYFNFDNVLNSRGTLTLIFQRSKAKNQGQRALTIKQPMYLYYYPDCLETTDWEALQGSHGENTEEMVDCPG